MTLRKTILLILLLISPPGLAEAQPRIIGGEETSSREWPSLVSVQDRKTPGAYWGHICGGTLVGKRWVLTARHCLGGRLDVVLGRSNLRERTGERIAVLRSYRHPRSDLALLYLARPSWQAPARLAASRPADGSPVRAAGWGATQTRFPARLRQVELQIDSDSVCRDAYPYDFLPSRHICASAPGRDTCQGDSGGPLVLKGRVVGITSFGKGCAEEGFPGVYASIWPALEWIKRVLRLRPSLPAQRPGSDSGPPPKPFVLAWTSISYPTPESPYFNYQTEISSNYHFREIKIRLVAEGNFCSGDSCLSSGEWLPLGTGPGGKSAVWSFRASASCPRLSFWARLEGGIVKSGSLQIC